MKTAKALIQPILSKKEVERQKELFKELKLDNNTYLIEVIANLIKYIVKLESKI